MDRAQILNKIRAMLALKENSTFDGEADNASRMIDALCAKYGITVDDAIRPQILDEIFISGRTRDYTKRILAALAEFYDAQAYYPSNGSVRVIGSEAQQIQVKLYYEFIVESMEKEAKKAYEGEKLLAELTGGCSPSRTFLHAFKLAFSHKVRSRLEEMKEQQNRKHEHAEYTLEKVNTYRFRRVRLSVGRGSGALAGQSAGENVSLNKQASGSSNRALCGV